jgi:GST-like protein
MYALIGYPGAGSSIVEAMLELADLTYKVEYVDLEERPADRERLAALNPLVQVPVLTLPDGTVMTESAAIALYLAEQVPAAGLAPPVGDAARAPFLRWLVFLVANVYPMSTVGDVPAQWVSGDAAGQELRASTMAYREKSWRVVEANIAPQPWFLGQRFSALDLYVAVMTRWRPRRDWFKANCPKLHAIALAADREPRLVEIWRRNFG